MKPVLFLLLSIVLLTACQPTDPCKEIQCENGGTCADSTCQCPDGYVGSRCEDELRDRLQGNYTVTKYWIDSTETDYPNVLLSLANRGHDKRMMTAHVFLDGYFDSGSDEVLVLEVAADGKILIKESALNKIIYDALPDSRVDTMGNITLHFTQYNNVSTKRHEFYMQGKKAK